MEDALAQAALDYHRYPMPGKIAVTPTKGMSNQRDLALAYSPGRRGPVPGDPEGPADGLRVHRQGQPGGGDLERHRRAGPGQYRRDGRQAGDGGQGLPVQEVRRDRRVRHRDRRDRPGQAGRDHRLARADLRRDQSRGHQGAGVLRDRDAAARADEDPGVPRRPARHGDRGGGGPAQRAARGRQGDRGRSSWSAPAPVPRPSPA